ncbi:MAG: hypothetical protein MK052_09075 [Alphaproteobacteria bacterium]|nr:hypothetical protein [Alphaproteobacteria bacterium]
MAFTFTSQQVIDIQNLLSAAQALQNDSEYVSGAYVYAYQQVYAMITDVDQITGEETPKAGIDSAIERGAWVFLRGVLHVNALW